MAFFKIGSAYNKANLTAKFVYNGLSKNSVAYLYNEDILVGKYIYEHDKQGNLVGVSIYADTDNYYAWGTTDQRLEFNYPSGEIHDNFYEMW